MIFCLGWLLVELPLVSGVDVLVSRNGALRTVSGQECSSTKEQMFMCREGAGAELAARVTSVRVIQSRMYG